MAWIHLAVMVVFWIYSGLCLRWPHQLVPAFIRQRRHWSKKCRHAGVRHVSHRGGAGENLENTMEAFRHALEVCRTDVLELDVQETRDGVAVVCHDANLKRLTGVDVDVKDLDFEQLPKLKAALHVSSEMDGVTVTSSDSPRARSFVRLEQVFDAFPNAVFNIDLKGNTTEFADKVAKLILKRALWERVVWGSDKSLELTEFLFDKYPEVPQFFGTRQVILATVLYWIGLLPFVTFRESYFQPPYAWLYVLRNHQSLDTTSWSEWFEYHALHFLFMQKPLFRHLSARGIPVWMWIMNDEPAFQKAFRDFGVDAVMTDYPSRLRQFLNHHHHQRKQQ